MPPDYRASDHYKAHVDATNDHHIAGAATSSPCCCWISTGSSTSMTPWVMPLAMRSCGKLHRDSRRRFEKQTFWRDWAATSSPLSRTGKMISDARALADRIIEIISRPFNIEGNEVNIATSIGIALAPEHATNSDSLMKMADLALYRAKAAGRNGYCFFDPEMSMAASARHALENELRRAVQLDELELHYQPIVDTKTLLVCGAEALIRWRHPTKIMPDQFIPLAEETGMITQIGEWLLQTACCEAARWPKQIRVAVNLSAIQFRRTLPTFLSSAEIRKWSSVPPRTLEPAFPTSAIPHWSRDRRMIASSLCWFGRGRRFRVNTC